jgi:hypothetical protein
MTSLIARDALVGNLLDKLEELERRIRLLEASHPGAPGETAGALAYYRPDDGSLRAPGELFIRGEQASLALQRDAYLAAWTETFDYDDDPTSHGWTWADDPPFVTPATVDTGSPGLLRVGFSGASDRAFLYRPGAPSDTSLFAMLALTSTAVDFAVGLRLDAGDDDHHLEVVLRVSQASPTQWAVQIRWRAGGGSVSTADGDAMNTPQDYVLLASIQGTLWSAWHARPILRGPLGGQMWKPNGGPAANSLTWSPARHGLVFYAGNSAVSWQRAIVKRYKGT